MRKHEGMQFRRKTKVGKRKNNLSYNKMVGGVMS